MPKDLIILSDNDIARIINGQTVSAKNFKGEEVEIRQSYMKDLAAPIINRDKKIYSNAEIENIKIATTMMADTFKLGY